jgi:glutamate carboxypeptidase
MFKTWIGKTVAGDLVYKRCWWYFVYNKYVDCIDGLGSSGKGAHAAGETINLKEFPYLIQRAAILIYRLTQN